MSFKHVAVLVFLLDSAILWAKSLLNLGNENKRVVATCFKVHG